MGQKHIFKISGQKEKKKNLLWSIVALPSFYISETGHIYKVTWPQMAGCNRGSSKYIIYTRPVFGHASPERHAAIRWWLQ